MAKVTASTADKRPVTVKIDVSGVPMDQLTAGKVARSIKGSLRYELGMGMSSDDDDLLEVIVTADAPTETPSTDEPESPEDEPEKLDAAAIAAMSPTEYRAAKAAGRI